MRKNNLLLLPFVVLFMVFCCCMVSCGNRPSPNPDESEALDSDTVISYEEVDSSVDSAAAVTTSADSAEYEIDEDSDEVAENETDDEQENGDVVDETSFITSPCPTCYGTGMNPRRTLSCPSCRGTGTVRLYETKDGGVRINSGTTHMEPCRNCNGTGFIPGTSRQCEDCQARGVFLVYD